MGEHRSRSRSASRSTRTFSVPETTPPPTPWLVALCDLFLIGAIAVVPLCYEGRTPFGVLLLTLCSAGGMLSWSLHQLTTSERRWRWSGSELLWFAACGLCGLQLTALPPEWIAQLSPKLATLLPAWTDGAGQPWLPERWTTLSVTPGATQAGLVIFLSLGMLFFTALQRLQTQADVERLLKNVALSSMAMAVFGLLQYFLANDNFFWIYPHPFVKTSQYVVASFPNRNHAAQYFVLGLGPALWWLIKLTPEAARTTTGFGTTAGPGVTSYLARGWLAAGTGTIVLATVLTLSRGGLLALVVAGLVTAMGMCRLQLLRWRTAGAVVMMAALGVCIIGASQFDVLMQRIQSEGTAIREPIWRANIALAKDFPYVGTGVGSHAEVYHPYLDEKYDGSVYTHAECSYLQVASETGLAGLSIAALMILLLTRWLVGVSLSTADASRSSASVAILASITAHLAHAIGDFLWYVPGLMAVVAVLAACGCRLWQLHRAAEYGRDADNTAGRFWWLLVGSSTACLTLWMTQQQWPAVQVAPVWDHYRLMAHAGPLDPNDPDAAELLAERQRDQLRTLMTVMKTDPRNTEASLAASQYLMGHFDRKQETSETNLPLLQLRDTVKAADMKTGKEVREWMTRAVGSNLKILDTAWAAALRTVKQSPCEGLAYVRLAELSFLRDPSGALNRTLLQQALAVRPYEPAVLMAAAEQAVLDGDEPRAIQYWQQAYRRGGPFPDRIMEILAAAKPPEFFLETFEPTHRQLVKLTTIFEGLERTDDLPALWAATADRAIEFARQHPNNSNGAEAWTVAAENYRLLEDRARRFKVLREAVEAQPQDPLLSLMLGRALFDEERYQEAADHLKAALRHYPDDAPLRELAENAVRKAQGRRRSNVRTASHTE